MRFWAYFAAKIVVAGLVLWGVLRVVDSLFPATDAAVPSLETQLNPAPKYRDRVVSIVPAPQIQTEEIPPAKLGGPARNSDPALDPRLLPLQHTGQVLAMNTALMIW